MVQTLVEKFYQKKPNKSVNPDEAVAIGAAIQVHDRRGETDTDCAILGHSRLLLLLLYITGRCAEGRRQGFAPARCDSAVTGSRDTWRCLHASYQQEHDNPDQEEPGKSASYSRTLHATRIEVVVISSS